MSRRRGHVPSETTMARAELAAMRVERDRLHAEVAALRTALKDLSDMYGHAWDLVDGGLMMMDHRRRFRALQSISRFERAHEAALAALAATAPDQPPDSTP